MRELAEGSDRYGADVSADGEGLWHFQVEAWGDPVAHWQHDAAIKIPLGQDVALMLAEGALLFERAAAGVRAHGSGGRASRAAGSGGRGSRAAGPAGAGCQSRAG